MHFHFKSFSLIFFSLLFLCGNAQNQDKKPGENRINSKFGQPYKVAGISLPSSVNIHNSRIKSVNISDECVRTFYKEYQNHSNGFFARQILKTNDGNLLVTATERANPYVANEMSSLTLLDTNGNIILTKLFPYETRINFSKVIKLRDGNFVAAGYLYYRYDSLQQYVVKFDQQLNIFWQKKIGSAGQYNNIVDIVESKEGDLYCYIADNHYSMKESRQLLKLNSSGDPVWFKEYDAGPNFFLGPGESQARLTELDDYIYLKYNEETGDFSPHLIKIRKSDGQVIWVKNYKDSAPPGYYAFSVFSLITDNTNIYLSGRNSSNCIILKISPDGDIVRSLILPNKGLFISSLIYKGDGKLFGSITTYSQKIDGIVELDTTFAILRRQYLQIPPGGNSYDIVNYSDSVCYGVGNIFINAYETNFTLKKYNFRSSFASCAVVDPGVSLDDYHFSAIDGFSAVTDLPIPQSIDYDGQLSSGTAAFLRDRCGNNLLCNSIKITGTKIICDSINTYNFYSNRNAGCDAIVNWELDTSQNQVQIISCEDSMLSLRIKKSGNFIIKAKIFGSCKWIEDSMKVQVGNIIPLALNLGSDTTLCSGNQLILNAHSGFNSYKWQDGSEDSVFIATKPGIYSLTTTDACGGIFNDTVNVIPHPPIPFDLGPDIAICANDTVIITAPPGFIHYQWTPYNVIADTDQVARIFPAISFMYKVIAEKTPGCFASDSIYVTVNRVPDVHLGNDTSFCSTQSITLDAGKGFDSYEWNTGDSTQKIVVSTPGIFAVNATLRQCLASDTMKVVNVYPLPAFSLGNDTVLCEGQHLQFNFNLPQATYNWSTGRTLNTGTFNLPGTYWLKITQMGCINSDTIDVKYNPSPVVVLGNDTTLCEKQTLQLNANNNNADYLWQDGSIAPDYLVKSAGTYFVTVNLDNCLISDTINISYQTIPFFTLGKDSFLCTGQQYVLQPVINSNANLLWQDGSSTPSFTVTKDGVYFLNATNECGSYTDSVTITTGICNIFMPTAFTPNNDGLNDVFRIKYSFVAKSFHLVIYNRFGEKVFETNNIQDGWNGTIRGEPSVQGAYVWIISYTDENGNSQQLKGVVTLIR